MKQQMTIITTINDWGTGVDSLEFDQIAFTINPNDHPLKIADEILLRPQAGVDVLGDKARILRENKKVEIWTDPAEWMEANKDSESGMILPFNVAVGGAT